MDTEQHEEGKFFIFHNKELKLYLIRGAPPDSASLSNYMNEIHCTYTCVVNGFLIIIHA